MRWWSKCRSARDTSRSRRALLMRMDVQLRPCRLDLKSPHSVDLGGRAVGWETFQETVGDTEIRRLEVHEGAQLTCDAHPGFFTIHWSSGVRLGAWLELLSSVLTSYEDEAHIVTVYW